MSNLKNQSGFTLAFVCVYTVLNLLSADVVASQELRQISAPKILHASNSRKPVVIAIVDDGVNSSHQDIKDFIWNNPLETGINNIDDDGNGHVDDLHGWDVSDDNNNTEPPANRLADYYHGTRLAGIITRVARLAYAENAPDFIRIMPVKAISDTADKVVVMEGFIGIQYAIDMGADIILCSWTISQMTPSQERILNSATEKGILVVASAGNFPQEMDQFPAAYKPVLAVAAIDASGYKAAEATYGQYVDIGAPGIDIYSADLASDTAYTVSTGSSYSAALTAAAAGIIKSVHHDYSATEISACLVNAATDAPNTESELIGKVGGGNLNIASALKCDLLTGKGQPHSNLFKSKDFLNLSNPKRKRSSWLIKPKGEFKGFRFTAHQLNKTKGKGVLKFYAGDSEQAKLLAEYALGHLPEKFYLPHTEVFIVLESKRKNLDFGSLLEYEIETIDFRTLYCKGQKNIDQPGILIDGSGDQDYSAASNCKWLITAPEGKLVHFEFTEFDTEPGTDFIYFFNGAGTHEDAMAGFSGPDIPPLFTSWHNQVLVWFVTNRQLQGKGWKANISFVDPE